MSYQRMTLVERMDIFRMLYVERCKLSSIVVALNRKPSGIIRELGKVWTRGYTTRYLPKPNILKPEGTGVCALK